MFDLFWLPNFIKIRHIAILRPNLPKLSISAISNIIFMINKLELLGVLNFIAMGIFFILGPNFYRMMRFYTCFNVEYVLLGWNCDFLGGYWSLPSGYCWLLLNTWWLLLVTGGYCSILLVTACSYFKFKWKFHQLRQMFKFWLSSTRITDLCDFIPNKINPTWYFVFIQVRW